MRFQGRARGAGTILGKDLRRDTCFGIPSGSHTSCARRSMDSDHSLPPKKFDQGATPPEPPQEVRRLRFTA